MMGATRFFFFPLSAFAKSREEGQKDVLDVHTDDQGMDEYS